jgi:ABC-type multidrug transport system fused ATPase/permease subunit
MADLSHFLSERLSALRAIRLHRAEGEEQERLAAASSRLNREVVDFQLLDSLSTGAPGLLLTLALAWIYLLGGRLLQTGAISLGTFVAFVLYQGRLFGPAQGLLGLVRGLQEARVSVARVAEVLGPEGSPAPSRGRGPALDEALTAGLGGALFENVSFAYPGKPWVLRGVTLRLDPGERVALFGTSGAGKSTLIQLLFGLREPGTGRVSVDGLVSRAVPAGLLGYAGAEPFLLHATVEENLRYGNPLATLEDLRRVAALAEADAFIRGLPEGYGTVIGGRGLALSDGQRQRLGLARLFLRAPRLLVLDEAFSGLDLETEARVRRNLWEAFPDRTALVISHRPVGLEEFDRILFLRDGRLSSVAPEELKALLLPDRALDDNFRSPWTEGAAHVTDPAH